MPIQFGSLHLPSIKPDETAYVLGKADDIKPGSVLKIIRGLVGEPVIYTFGAGEGPRPKSEFMAEDAKLQSNIPVHERYMLIRELQQVVVDEYVVNPDGQSATLQKRGASDSLGCKLDTGMNELLTELKLLDEKRLQVVDDSRTDNPIINLVS